MRLELFWHSLVVRQKPTGNLGSLRLNILGISYGSVTALPYIMLPFILFGVQPNTFFSLEIFFSSFFTEHLFCLSMQATHSTSVACLQGLLLSWILQCSWIDTSATWGHVPYTGTKISVFLSAQNAAGNSDKPQSRRSVAVTKTPTALLPGKSLCQSQLAAAHFSIHLMVLQSPQLQGISLKTQLAFLTEN